MRRILLALVACAAMMGAPAASTAGEIWYSSDGTPIYFPGPNDLPGVQNGTKPPMVIPFPYSDGHWVWAGGVWVFIPL